MNDFCGGKVIFSDLSAAGSIVGKKLDLVKSARASKSIRDYGGLYQVHGKYLLEPAVALGANFVSMIDGTVTPQFKGEIAKARESLPELEVELIKTDFRNPHLYDILRPVDTSILFEVLLHQENYVSVIGGVAQTTKRHICVAQPCVKESVFSVPASATLLQFWPEELKDKYREGAIWPKEPQVDKFTTWHWMWGISTSNLVACFKGFGWDLGAGEIVACAGNFWDYSLLQFTPRN